MEEKDQLEATRKLEAHMKNCQMHAPDGMIERYSRCMKKYIKVDDGFFYPEYVDWEGIMKILKDKRASVYMKSEKKYVKN